MATSGAQPVIGGMRSKIVWVGISVSLLSMQVLLGGVAIYFATSDPSWMVEPDYHAKAIDWDQTQAKRRASNELGWKGNVTFGGIPDMYGFRDVQLALTDRQGAGITGANIRLRMYHHARARDAEDVDLSEQNPGSGVYVGKARMRKAGLWQIHLEAVRGEDSFLLDSERELPTDGGAVR